MTEPRHGLSAGPWPPPFSPSDVARARALLESRPAVVVVGPPGSGRNRLAAEIAGVDHDSSVLTRHVARHGEKDVRWFAVQQLMPELDLPSGADEQAVESAVRAAVETRSDRPTFVLANAHLCDPGSITVLSRVAATGDLQLVATLTPETVIRQPHLLSVAEVVQLLPLDSAAVAELLQARFGAAPHPRVVALLLERTSGSYGVLREICDAAYESGLIVAVEGVLILDPDRSEATTEPQIISPWALETIERLGGGAGMTDLIHLTSILGELDLAEARRHLDPVAIEQATEHGTLRAVDGGLRFAAHAEATLIRQTLPVERRRALFDRWSALFTATLERPGVAVLAAEWWAAADHLLPLDLAARAAREANLSGRHRHALAFTEPSRNEKDVVAAPLERAFALREVGAGDELGPMFESLDPQELSETELLPYLLWANGLTGPARARLVERAISSQDPEDARRRSAVNTLAGLLERCQREAGEELTSQLRALTFSAPLSPHNRALAFTALSSVQRLSAHPERAVESAEFALRLLLEDPERLSAFHLDVTRERHVLALLTSLDVEKAERAIVDYSSGVLGLAGSGRMALALRTRLSLVRGDAQDALVNARLCLASLRQQDPHQIRGWVEAMLALILVQCGRHDEAHDLLEVSRSHPASLIHHDLDRRIAQACAHDALAEPEEALALLAEVAQEARAHQLRLAEIDACVLSVQIGGPPHMPMLLDAVDGLVDPAGTPAVWQTFVRAARAYDIPTLVSLAERLDARDARFFAAAVAQYVLDMARRATDLEPGTRTLLQQLADPVSHRHIEPT